MEKMSVKDQTITRKNLYEATQEAVQDRLGYSSEPIATGLLINLGNGHFAKCTISICDATKFDLDSTRQEYQDKLNRQAELAAKRAEAAAAKALKANKENNE